MHSQQSVILSSGPAVAKQRSQQNVHTIHNISICPGNPGGPAVQTTAHVSSLQTQGKPQYSMQASMSRQHECHVIVSSQHLLSILFTRKLMVLIPAMPGLVKRRTSQSVSSLLQAKHDEESIVRVVNPGLNPGLNPGVHPGPVLIAANQANKAIIRSASTGEQKVQVGATVSLLCALDRSNRNVIQTNGTVLTGKFCVGVPLNIQSIYPAIYLIKIS